MLNNNNIFSWELFFRIKVSYSSLVIAHNLTRHNWSSVNSWMWIFNSQYFSKSVHNRKDTVYSLDIFLFALTDMFSSQQVWKSNWGFFELTKGKNSHKKFTVNVSFLTGFFFYTAPSRPHIVHSASFSALSSVINVLISGNKVTEPPFFY